MTTPHRRWTWRDDVGLLADVIGSALSLFTLILGAIALWFVLPA